jgi:hypothetical protein
MRQLFRVVAAVCLITASLQAQKPCCGGTTTTTTKPPSGGGSTTPTCPPGVTLSSGELTATFHGNECTEGITDANLGKQMPNATINGFTNLFHLALPGVSLVQRGSDWEHTIAYHDAGYSNFFAPRQAHMPIEVLDAQTLQMCQHDPDWNTDACLVYHMVGGILPSEAHAIDLTFTIVYNDVSKFAPENAVSEFFANYMPLTSDVGLYGYCVPSAGAPEQWCRFDTTQVGMSWQHVDAAQPLVDPAPTLPPPGIQATYKDSLRTADYPRYTRPFYCTVNTNTNTVYQMMFDRTSSLVDQILFTLFKYHVKTDNTGSPAQDWRYSVTNPVQGQAYGYRARISARPRLSSGSIEAECDAEYVAWLATLQIQ